MSKKRLNAVFILAWVLLMTVPAAAQKGIGITASTSGDSADYYNIKSLLQKALLRHDSRAAAKCYQQIGDIFFKEGVMPQAMEYYFKADEQFSLLGNQIDLADNLQRMGKVYFKNTKDDLALSTFQRAANISANSRHFLGIAEAEKYIAQIFLRRGDTVEAHNYFQLALKAYLKLHQTSQVAFTYAKIGGIYEDEGQYKEALKYFFKSVELYQRQGEPAQTGVINNIGDTYRKMGDHSKALKYTKQAEYLAIRDHDQQQLSSAHRDLAKVYEQTGRFDSAYYYSEKARAAYAKSFNSDSDKKLNLLQALFEVQKKNAAIDRLESDKQVNKILSISVSLIALLIGFLSYSLVSRQRIKNQTEKMIYQQQNKSMELELINKELKAEGMKAQLELQSKELSSHTLLIIQKNQFLESLRVKVMGLIKDDKRDQRKELKQLIGLIDENSDQDKNWEDFRVIYENIHENFFDKLKAYATSLTSTDLRFLALLKMNMEPVDIATMLGISPNSLRTTRYRVKKKLRLDENESLTSFIQQI